MSGSQFNNNQNRRHGSTRGQFQQEEASASLGLQQNSNFYQLLNLSQTATTQEINKQYRHISRSIHPDKAAQSQQARPSPSQQTPPQLDEFNLDAPANQGQDDNASNQPQLNDEQLRREVFIEVQRAYGYLTNSLTRTIYDAYGLVGISAYEKSKKEYTQLQDEIRGLDSAIQKAKDSKSKYNAETQQNEDQQNKITNTDLSEVQRLIALEQEEHELSVKREQVQASIERKTRSLLSQGIANYYIQTHERIYSVEYGIDAKAFCNYFSDFYRLGQLPTCAKLIRQKHLVGSIRVKLPLPLKSDPAHNVKLVITSQNDLKKALGVTQLQLIDSYALNKWIGLKTTLQYRDGFSVVKALNFKFMDGKIGCKLQNDSSIVQEQGQKGFGIQLLGKPNISLTSTQFDGFTLEAEANAEGSLKFGISRDPAPTEKLGASVSVSLNQKKVSFEPMITYQYNKKILLTTQLDIDSNKEIRQTIGAQFRINKSNQVTLNLVLNFSDWSKLGDTMIVSQWIHQGYALKIPIFTCNQGWSNPVGLGITLGIFGGMNIASLFALKKMKSKKSVLQKQNYQIAFAQYQTGIESLTKYVREKNIFLNASINNENKVNGLIIREAYYGLAEHIYKLESGLVKYKKPESVQDYYELQVIPMRKILQIKVENSQLVLKRADFEKRSQSFFNPCVNKATKCLLLVSYQMKGLEKVLIYDFSKEVIVVPTDVQN